MKIDWQWPGAVAFTAVFLAVSFLIYAGKAQPEMLGVLLAWLVPSPMQGKNGGSS